MSCTVEYVFRKGDMVESPAKMGERPVISAQQRLRGQ